nr:HipA domain-containing protein [Frondihabitans sp. PAMC 28766]
MTELDVLLDGARCGRVTQSASGNLSFTYDDEYRVNPVATPLPLSMLLAGAVHKERVVLPALQGLLPDSEEALRAIGRRFAANPANPFALLRHVGSEVAGAVQLVEPGTAGSDATAGRTSVRRVSDDEVATMLEHVVSEYADGISNDDAVGRFSLAGAQPKIALHRLPNGTWGVPEDATPTTHILKPVTGDVRRIDVVEQMTMHAAAFLGNTVASSELMTLGGRDVFVTERYDRSVVDGRWVRLHQEDLCQSLSVSPSKKYQHRDGGGRRCAGREAAAARRGVTDGLTSCNLRAAASARERADLQVREGAGVAGAAERDEADARVRAEGRIPRAALDEVSAVDARIGGVLVGAADEPVRDAEGGRRADRADDHVAVVR